MIEILKVKGTELKSLDFVSKLLFCGYEKTNLKWEILFSGKAINLIEINCELNKSVDNRIWLSKIKDNSLITFFYSHDKGIKIKVEYNSDE